jgi:arylsulfatase A-like enzyme
MRVTLTDGWYKTYPELFREAGYYCTNNSKTHYNCDIDPHTIWDETSSKAHWRNRADEQPFLAVFNEMFTHESCTFTPQSGGSKPDNMRIPSYLPDIPAMRESLVRYYSQIARMDAFVGDRLAELDADGIANDTIVFYYSDHASPLPRSKRFCYDEGLGVPFIVRIPEHWRHLLPAPPGTIREDAPISLVDLFPTLLTIADIKAPSGLQGQAFLGASRNDRTYVFGARDRMDERYDFSRSVRSMRFRYIRNYAPHRAWGQHYAYAWEGRHYQDYEEMHLTGSLNSREDRFWNPKPAEELYDIAADPDQTANLVCEPRFESTLAAMSRALDDHMLAIRDAGFIPEGSPLEIGQAYENEEIYPLAEIISLANRVIRRDPLDSDLLCERLLDHRPVVRYWAAQGLLMIALRGCKLPQVVEHVRTQETEPTVMIALAEALGHAGNSDVEAEKLVHFVLTQQHPKLRLQGLIALTEMQYDPSIALPLASELSEDPDEYVRGAATYLKLRLDGNYTPQSKVFRHDLFRP